MIERRFVTGQPVELRTVADRPFFMGYAAVFNSLSEDLGGFVEKIAPGAFDDVLSDDVRALWNHDPNHVLGRTVSGTLRLKSDKEGLFYEIDPPDTQMARDLQSSIKRGDVDQSSFGFNVAAEGEVWTRDETGVVTRTITKIGRLYDVSPVTYPAYPETKAQARQLFEAAEQRNLIPPTQMDDEGVDQMGHDVRTRQLFNLKLKVIK